ncbi:MAG: DUF5107 domain-containing protein [Saprospiraceae bacterium]|nr:DUF5107 domain-containing protein [Saprospiraceae bacterium]
MKALITESTVSLQTYPFSDPDPVPILSSNTKIYPYFKYEGYSHEASPQDWTVVTLENDYIEVSVLPQVGGKVWGAIEKSTGEEFIYRNEVMKFRNISMRGPWTSGGIEFNFGIIGHHPSTATPVDYKLRENDDGSVSCIVGNIDLPSRTQWRVEIRLPADKAYFETRVIWYNPTPLTQSYYNWMTAAAFAQEDLVFYCPGDQYLSHPGQAFPWPLDEAGRDISRYHQNDFGPSKSYHVVGVYDDFFGGYFEKEGYGFGHWSPYEEMPGQKLWLWALSRSGGIWEDLLTDTDGQYIEFQAGRLFDQFSPGKEKTVLSQAAFEPGQVDIWREIWFPVKEIGGMSEVSAKAVLHVAKTDSGIDIGLNALQKDSGMLQVTQDGLILYEEKISMRPMDVYRKSITCECTDNFEIRIDQMDLHYRSNPDKKEVDRPFDPDPNYDAESRHTNRTYRRGWEALKYREFDDAATLWSKCLEEDPFHKDALIGMAELSIRWAQYEEGIGLIKKALRLDTYDPHANYIAAELYHASGAFEDALECYGWAARSTMYRADAYARIANIYLRRLAYDQAQRYARNALDFNRFHLGARQILAVLARARGNTISAVQQLATMLTIDPLNHFAHFEQFLISPSEAMRDKVQKSHRSEFPYQTYLELAISYYRMGRGEDALVVLDLAPQHPLVDLWWSYVQRDTLDPTESNYFTQLSSLPVERVFPYRTETLAVLEWADQFSDGWKTTYYLALNYWGIGRKAKALGLVRALGNRPEYAPFYLTRAKLAQANGEHEILADLTKAHELDAEDWRTWKALIQYHQENEEHVQMLNLTESAIRKFPTNYNLGMDHASALLSNGQPAESIRVLNELNVLPFEGAYGGRSLWEQAHHVQALMLIEIRDLESAIAVCEEGKTWPENLGVGMPFEPDSRVADYILAHCYSQKNMNQMKDQVAAQIIDFTKARWHSPNPNHVLGLAMIEKQEGRQAALTLMDQVDDEAAQHNVYRWLRAYLLNDASVLLALEQEGDLGISAQALDLVKQSLALD